MAFDLLASIGDLPNSAPGDSIEQAAALSVASAAIRDAAGSAISETTGTIRFPGTSSKILTLPRASEVTAVTIDGVTVTNFTAHAEGLFRRCGWGDMGNVVEVTGTFGMAEVPADIVDLCVQLAVAKLQHDATGGGSIAGLASTSVDDASESYTDEASGSVSPVFIPEATRAWLARRFSGSAAVVVETV